MKDARSLLNHLQVAIEEEIQAQLATLSVLERQEEAVRGRRLADVTEASAELDVHAQRAVQRTRRRDDLLRQLSATWGVPRSVLSLSSIAERAGSDGQRIADLRSELRASTAEVHRRNRRLATLIGHHRKLIRDVMECVVASGETQDGEGGQSFREGGSLLDAEA